MEKAEKLGIFTGLRVTHPVKPGETLPVYVANFVLMDYGTGAIFGCPAHDQRDLDFARKYGLPVIPVVLPPDADPATFAVRDEAYVGPGTIYHSDFLDGLSRRARPRTTIAEYFGARQVGNRPQGTRRDQLSAARLGHFAPALLGLPDPGDPLPDLRHRAGAGRRLAGQAA